MSFKSTFIIVSIISFISVSCAIQYPIVQQASPINLQSEIQSAISRGQSSLTLPSGTYRVENHLMIANAKNFILDGNYSDIIFTSKAGKILIYNSESITIRNLKIDYDPLPYTQGTITSVELSRSRGHEGRYLSLTPVFLELSR